MDVVGLSHEQLGAEAYYFVIINTAMKCLTLNGLQKSLMDGRATFKHSNKKTRANYIWQPCSNIDNLASVMKNYIISCAKQLAIKITVMH